MKPRKARTQLTRDAALATGKTCIACGAESVARVGDYPGCERHRSTVSPPDPRQRWKKNVRDRHGRIRTEGRYVSDAVAKVALRASTTGPTARRVTHRGPSSCARGVTGVSKKDGQGRDVGTPIRGYAP